MLHDTDVNLYNCHVIARPVDEDNLKECQALARHIETIKKPTMEMDDMHHYTFGANIQHATDLPFGVSPKVQTFITLSFDLPEAHQNKVNSNAIIFGGIVIHAVKGLEVYTVGEWMARIELALYRTIMSTDRDALSFVLSFMCEKK